MKHFLLTAFFFVSATIAQLPTSVMAWDYGGGLYSVSNISFFLDESDPDCTWILVTGDCVEPDGRFVADKMYLFDCDWIANVYVGW